MSEHDAYMETVNRLEPDLHPLDTDAALASIAVSLKRIADAVEQSASFANGNWPQLFTDQVCDAIRTGIWNAQGRR